jgi:hypothetical protein
LKPELLGLQDTNDIRAYSNHAEVERATNEVAKLMHCTFGLVFREKADGIQNPKFIVG